MTLTTQTIESKKPAALYLGAPYGVLQVKYPLPPKPRRVQRVKVFCRRCGAGSEVTLKALVKGRCASC